MNPFLLNVAIGFAALLAYLLFCFLVIKAEYYFSCKFWPVFLILSAVLAYLSYYFANNYVESIFGLLSPILAILAFASLWSAIEIKAQPKKVMKGLYPRNPKRPYDNCYPEEPRRDIKFPPILHKPRERREDDEC
ncbi:MAG: DUF4491 family protein [Eubacteriaceae bacterium]|nr:DUF4491 family protein [Eubacteriaceae bacterium]